MVYNREVVCVIDQGQEPQCETKPLVSRRNIDIDPGTPWHDVYIPRENALFYNCTNARGCQQFKLYSLTQIVAPTFDLKQCYVVKSVDYQCESIRYNHLKNIDKLLFLSKNIVDKSFYLVDCLVYSDSYRVCTKNKDAKSYAELIDVAERARRSDQNVLSQDEFLCEEDNLHYVTCDLNAYVPHTKGLNYTTKTVSDQVLLKTDDRIVQLKFSCIDNWCGFIGPVLDRARRKEEPGGTKYRCLYSQGQQVCKVIVKKKRPGYFDVE